ncbi:hypothetical protein B0H66DRAFT_632861 [Apodospora peruviana]|uniref:Protein kinase domain-containing protein n=1 Tax=Apodospora peruviana TaxID=516989 RepID=A0AAE0HSS6_9PEZI|nr:hypothetical protein B0H66DRAFT_632861 [Apodospora peruviana]
MGLTAESRRAEPKVYVFGAADRCRSFHGATTLPSNEDPTYFVIILSPRDRFRVGDPSDAVFDPNLELIMIESRNSYFEATRHELQPTQEQLRAVMARMHALGYTCTIKAMRAWLAHMDHAHLLATTKTSSPPPELEETSLHELLYAETLHFRLKTADNNRTGATIIPITPAEAYQDYVQIEDDHDHDNGGDGSECDFQPIDDELPQYSSKEIQVLDVITGGGVDSVARTIRIFSVASSGQVRIPKLIGYVKHADNGHIIGLFREWIPGCDMRRMCCDDDLDSEPMSDERKKKWAAQIRETVDQLYGMGLVWGDGKPGNVIISDKDDDAWLIDLAGGWTNGWVDEELVDTPGGDDQAVSRIFKFLDVEEAKTLG